MGFGPGGLDCDEVLDDLYLYLDDETDPAARDKMRAHIHECGPCLRALGVEQDLKSLIARTCGGDVAPRELHERIRNRLIEVSIETSYVEYRAD